MKKPHFYHPELDILRFFAFFMVFVHHGLAQYVPMYTKQLGTVAAGIVSSVVLSGGLGVDLFFCLSSFLITKLLLIEHQQSGTISIKSFYVRRILRIWPLYFFFTFAAIFLFPLILKTENLPPAYVRSFLFFFANWACAFSGYPSSVAAPLWSVSIEEQFYLTWPIVLKAIRMRKTLALFVSLLIVSTLTRLYLALIGAKHPAIWCNTFTRMDPIALGAIFALYYDRMTFSYKLPTRLALLATGCVLPVTYLYFFMEDAFSGLPSLFFYPIVAIASLLVIAAVIKQNLHLRDESRFGRLMVYLGRISYGLYVYHLLSINLVDQYLTGPMLGIRRSFLLSVVKLPLEFLLTVLLAHLSFQLLELPFLSFKKKFTKVSSAPAASA